ncbi:IPP transferase-domain-containing protein [Emericellopsis atlantica]|uniref:tRNA dimethylallyltransferase n=1 Tax=Emericellopsis atlantica TaxID=2614577 RepID=A0A9P8CMJ4_9HYPO|nr:IPP transferase-domain-containing protein [Emericellopsis atlantica]KAG9252177.1 IPP transferase-domain-containing protein [Emericellopsis atlantica]
MATCPKPPAQPLLVILGSTGTGKSELAVELAKRFRGEVINADAMQMYNGLPIMTNKMSVAEQQGIPHHLLGNIAPTEESWTVDGFQKEVSKILGEIRDRGNLPIVVGGTAYYVDALLFDNTTLHEDVPQTDEPLPILDEPTEVLFAELQKVDPVMAERWHPNDRRKILRSLEIYLRTGRPASELYAEQKQKRSASRDSPWENLLFWVYSEGDVLKERLDRRVDKMLDAGLIDEARQLLQLKREEEAAGRPVDQTRGIWQVLGYKQLEPYLLALEGDTDPVELERIKASGIEDLKTGTRRYANYQNKWTRRKKLPHLKEEGPEALNSLYLLDSTTVAKFGEDVVEPASRLTAQFLKGEARELPVNLSDPAREVLTAAHASEPDVHRKQHCDICNLTIASEKQWALHLHSRQHRARLKKKKGLALVPVSVSRPDSEFSEPEISSIFDSTI